MNFKMNSHAAGAHKHFVLIPYYPYMRLMSKPQLCHIAFSKFVTCGIPKARVTPLSRLKVVILEGEGYIMGNPVHYVIVKISINQSVGVYRP